jgi:hypothetical protein
MPQEYKRIVAAYYVVCPNVAHRVNFEGRFKGIEICPKPRTLSRESQ